MHIIICFSSLVSRFRPLAKYTLGFIPNVFDEFFCHGHSEQYDGSVAFTFIVLRSVRGIRKDTMQPRARVRTVTRKIISLVVTHAMYETLIYFLCLYLSHSEKKPTSIILLVNGLQNTNLGTMYRISHTNVVEPTIYYHANLWTP